MLPILCLLTPSPDLSFPPGTEGDTAKRSHAVFQYHHWSRKRLLLEGVGAWPECFKQGRDRRTASVPCGCVSLRRVSQLENLCSGLWLEFSSGSSFICMENEDLVLPAALWSSCLGCYFLSLVIYFPKKTPFRMTFPHFTSHGSIASWPSDTSPCSQKLTETSRLSYKHKSWEVIASLCSCKLLLTWRPPMLQPLLRPCSWEVLEDFLPCVHPKSKVCLVRL